MSHLITTGEQPPAYHTIINLNELPPTYTRRSCCVYRERQIFLNIAGATYFGLGTAAMAASFVAACILQVICPAPTAIIATILILNAALTGLGIFNTVECVKAASALIRENHAHGAV